MKESEIVPALLEELEPFIDDEAAGNNIACPEILPDAEGEPKGTPLVTFQ